MRVFFRHRLRREDRRDARTGTRVAAIRMENGATFRAKVFADATYEGDLMAQAGVSYTFGREGSRQYGESLAGVRDRTPLHQFQVNVPARDASGAAAAGDLRRAAAAGRHRRHASCRPTTSACA